MLNDGYYGVAYVTKSIFDKIDDSMLIANSTDLVKYLCANEKETIHLNQIGINTNGVVCDWYKILLIVE